MKETKLKRLIKKMMDSIFLDAMTPEFKSANAELLKAIKMNDKSGAVPHTDLEAVNKAMKENDAEKAGAALKNVQLQFSKAEKKLDEDVKSIQAKLETTKKAAETAKASLKQKKALEPVFDKLKALVSGLSNNPKSASKLTALTDKVKDYGDLSKRASQIITLVSSNKDASKQIDMLKKSVDAAEKKYKKDLANVEKESKKADDALEVAKMQAKITQGKKDAFQKERLYLAKVVKVLGEGVLPMDVPERKEKVFQEKMTEIDKAKNELYAYIRRIGEIATTARKELDAMRNVMHKHKTAPGEREEMLEALVQGAITGYKQINGSLSDQDTIKEMELIKNHARNDYTQAKFDMQAMSANDKVLKKLFVKPLNFMKKIEKDRDDLYSKNYNGLQYDEVREINYAKDILRAASDYIRVSPSVRTKVESLLKKAGDKDLEHLRYNLRSGYLSI